MNDTSVSSPFDAEDRANRRTILLISLALAGLCCCAFAVVAFFWFKPDPQALIAEYFPSATMTASPEPTRTPIPLATATNTPSPTPNFTATAKVLQATDTAVAAQSTVTNAAGTWRVVLTDTFDSNKNKWLNEASDDEFAKVNYQVVEGVYRWDVTTHKSFIGWVRASTKTFSDFYVSADVKQVSGPDTADYGIVFREDDNGNFYYFGINDRGQYILYEYFGEWRTLSIWTKSDLLKAGDMNRIAVLGEGSYYSLYVNDQYLTSFTNEDIAQGTIALAIEMADANDEGVFEFDNFELRKP